ncbi:MAG: PAS domain S-box protein [Bacteroidales bacterium]|nr:PAS domain S-box protein [Bacteroidales bacterium]
MQENIFSFLFENSSDAIFLSDSFGDIIEVNSIACNLMGYEKDELLSLNFREIKSPRYRNIFSENIQNIITNKVYTYETEHIKKNGDVCPIEIKSRLAEYNGKQVIISVARNIHRRKAYEQKLLQTIIKTEEKERKRFAEDLHDGLSPILSTIKLYADLLKKDDFKQTSKEQIINDIEELAELSISTAKEIANNITPNILHDLGLVSAIKEFCNYINNTKKIRIELNTDKYEPCNNDLVESVIFQAVKELINNALKHSEADVVVLELKSNNNQIILYYKDDGIGFNVNNVIGSSGGLGLNNITNKIKSIKGNCDFSSRENKGLIFMAVIKL